MMYDQEIQAPPQKASVRNRLKRISVTGYKTLNPLTDLELLSGTVLIGPNGAGKSNFISFFRMMYHAISGQDQLARYVGQHGGAGRLLHDGPDHTQEIKAKLTIETPDEVCDCEFGLFYAANDTLVFNDERYRLSTSKLRGNGKWSALGTGYKKTKLSSAATENRAAGSICTFLKELVVYHFHNSSNSACIRGKWNANDNRYLRSDGANIAPVLFRLKTQENHRYPLIINHIRLVLPMFDDFVLEPEHGYLTLKWREKDTNKVFDASQASGGFLHIVTLVTLLLQPSDDLPDILILDEPELGLHPYASGIIGNLIASAALDVQVIVATQSPIMINSFDVKDIVVVERHDRASTFRRLDPLELDEWLEDHALSTLWEKNVFGGNL